MANHGHTQVIPAFPMDVGAPLGGASASSYASFPAPDGYHWDFMTQAERMTTDGYPAVILVAN